MVDQLGSPNTYNHYPTGWAMAFSTPYRMFKRYVYQGGVCDPLVIHWPAGHHGQGRGPRPVPPLAPTSSPTILDVCGVDDARRLQRRHAEPAVGRVDALLVRRRRRADRRSTPSTTRCSATAASGTTAGRRSPSTARWPARSNFDDDRWQLFHTDEDRAEAHDLADRAPRQARGAEGAVVRRRPRPTTCCR